MWQTYSNKGKKCEIWCDLIIHSDTGNEINAVLGVTPHLGFKVSGLTLT